MILRIERAWGKTPGWFATLEEADQRRLYAMWQAEHLPGDP